MTFTLEIDESCDLAVARCDGLVQEDEIHDAIEGCGAPPAFRSVLIAPPPFHRRIAELYKAIWDSHELPGVAFSVVTSVDERRRSWACGARATC